MKNLVITLHGYGRLLKEKFRGKPLFDYADVPNFKKLTDKGRWGYIRLGRTFEKAYFGLFGDVSDFPGESYIRSLENHSFNETSGTFFLAGFVSSADGRIIEADLKLTDREINGLLRSVIPDDDRFRFRVKGGEAIIWFQKGLPMKDIPFPGSLVNRRFRDILHTEREFSEINSIILNSAGVLPGHPINMVREDLSEPSGNILWLWGMGQKRQVVSFSDRIGKRTLCLSTENGLKGTAEILGFQEISDISMYGGESFLWAINSLEPEENHSIWLKRFERLDRDLLGHMTDTAEGEDFRILFILDSFSGRNSPVKNEWGIYCLSSNGSPSPPRPGRHIKKGRLFMEAFSG